DAPARAPPPVGCRHLPGVAEVDVLLEPSGARADGTDRARGRARLQVGGVEVEHGWPDPGGLREFAPFAGVPVVEDPPVGPIPPGRVLPQVDGCPGKPLAPEPPDSR